MCKSIHIHAPIETLQLSTSIPLSFCSLSVTICPEDFRNWVEALVRSREKMWTFVMWRSHLERNRNVLEKMKQKRKVALQNSKFVKVFPTKGENAVAWKNIMTVISQMPSEVTDSYQLPRLVDYIPPQQRTPHPIRQVDMQKSRRIVTPLKKIVRVA